MSTSLTIAGLTKFYGETRVLGDVDLRVERGSVHALLGGNGSGKSTLVKVLAGVASGTHTGMIEVETRSTEAGSLTPSWASEAGLRFVHQDLGMIRTFSVADNLALVTGYPVGIRGIKRAELEERAADLLARFDIDANPRTRVGDLRPSTQTMIAIASALRDDDARVLVLDEPTASLPDQEVGILMDALRRRADIGQTIVYVSHRLPEVFQLADAITVLRDGSVALTADRERLTERLVIEAIAGKSIDRIYPQARQRPLADPVLVVEDAAVTPIRRFDVTVNRGEIVGVAGLLGSGRTELLTALFGATQFERGTVRLGAASGPFASPRTAMIAGMALVPEDRQADAAFENLSVERNLSAGVPRRHLGALGLSARKVAREAVQLVTAFRVKSRGVDVALSTLSGGNQQKVILARWLRRKPMLLLLDEPTQGVDVVARSDIYDLIRTATSEGTAVLVASSDFEELAHLCDRVLVLNGGGVVSELSGPELTAQALTVRCYADAALEHEGAMAS